MANATVQGVSFDQAPYLPIHRKVAFGAFSGQIADGYTLGIVGIALSFATEPLGLNSFWLGVCGAASMFGILFGSLIIGKMADVIGRRQPFTLVMVALLVLSAAQFFVANPLQLAILRFCLGMVIGSDYTVGITFLSEWSPVHKRDNTMSMLLVTWTVGYVIAYIVGFFMKGLGPDGWRWVLSTSAIPAFIALLFRFGSPESPAWLATKQRTGEALAIIHKYIGTEYGLPPAKKEVASAAWSELFGPKLRFNTLVSGVFFACQVLPFFALSIFLPLVLTKLNVDNPYASGILYNVFTIIGVLVGLWLMTRITRRAYLLWTFYGAAVILTIMTVWQDMPGYLALIMLTAFSLVMAIAIVLEFIYPPELFPTELRGSGVGLTIAISRIGAGGGTFLLPIVNEHFGIYAALAGCIGALLLGGIVCHLWAPETSQKGLATARAKAAGSASEGSVA